MKYFAFLRGLTFLLCAVCQASEATRISEQLRLLNDDGTPLPGIDINVKSIVGWRPGRDFGTDIFDEQKIRTQADGVAKFSINSRDGVLMFEIANTEKVYGQRWTQRARIDTANPIDVFAKSVVHPIPMYVRQVGFSKTLERNLPEIGSDCGFDLLKADWVSPNGTGIVSDIVFRLEEVVKLVLPQDPFDLVLTISVPGRHNGVLSAKSKEPGPTVMPLQRLAPSDGFSDKLTFRMWRLRGEGVKNTIGDSADRNSGYFIRIRATSDAHGNVSSAIYGKVTGTFEFNLRSDGKVFLRFMYFINPVENDRNMENRLDTNRFADLDPQGRVQ